MIEFSLSRMIDINEVYDLLSSDMSIDKVSDVEPFELMFL